MSSMKVTTKWVEKHVFESTQEGRTAPVVIDGDRVEGPGPKSLLLSGLAGCSAIDVVDILQKMRVDFSDFSVEANADVVEEHPKVFAAVALIYKIRTAQENEEKVKKAIDLSLDKYCGVAAMLKKNAPITYIIELL